MVNALRTNPRRSITLLLVLPLLTASLAGCIGDGDESELPWASYDEAKAADGPVFEPNQTSPLRVKWLQPATPDSVPQGQSDIRLLVFDSEADEPVTDAELQLASRMPAMGHGTSSETDPAHEDFGVYKGVINPIMGGEWELDLQVTLASGQTLDFTIGYSVQGEGGMDGDGHDHDHGGNASTAYGSYEAAKNASGPTLTPEGSDSDVRLKLLEPPFENASQGEQNVTVLLFDNSTDEPIEDANMTLETRMPAMGHGTSPEEDPTHTEHGVYVGLTNFVMDGRWVLNLDATLADGDELSFSTSVYVGQAAPEDGEEPPPFEPYNVTFEDDVSSPDYNRSWSLEVKGANASITMNATLGNGTMLTDELNVTLFDANGTALGALVLSADNAEGTLALDAAPEEGMYSVRVTGRALSASYVITVDVAPP